jgi:hypothetical protein
MGLSPMKCLNWDEGTLKFWSNGSTTYLMLAEFFPQEE